MSRPSRPATILASAAFVASQGYLALLLHKLRPNILSLQLTFRSERYWEILGLWGPEGVRAYRGHFAADFLHLVVYAVFGYVLALRAGLFAPTEQRAARRLAWLLPVAALFDLIENLLQLRLLAGPFGEPSIAIPLSALCSSFKWGLAVIFAVIVGRRAMSKFLAGGRSSR